MKREGLSVVEGGELRRTLALLVARPFFALARLLGLLLPARALLAIAAGCSRCVFTLFPGVRRNLLSNARNILGVESSVSERRRLARGILASFARFIVEWVAPKCLARPESIFEDLRGKEHFDRAVARGNGVIAITLHMGNYELPGRELAALGHEVAIVFNRERISFLERLRSSSRREKNLAEIVIDESRFFAIEVYRRLKEGGIVLLAGDQVGAPDAQLFRFLHGNARFSCWPARLAASSGAMILPSFCTRAEDGSCRLAIEPPIEAGERDPLDVMEEVVGVLARYLERYPDQWLMVHEFWLSETVETAAGEERPGSR